MIVGNSLAFPLHNGVSFMSAVDSTGAPAKKYPESGLLRFYFDGGVTPDNFTDASNLRAPLPYDCYYLTEKFRTGSGDEVTTGYSGTWYDVSAGVMDFGIPFTAGGNSAKWPRYSNYRYYSGNTANVNRHRDGAFGGANMVASNSSTRYGVVGNLSYIYGFPVNNYDMAGMFSGNSSITSIKLKLGTLGDAVGMFAECPNLVDARLYDVGDWNTHSVFRNCPALQNLEVSARNASADIRWIASGCSSLTGVTAGPSPIVGASGAFYGCSSLSNVNISGTIVGPASAFCGCNSLTAFPSATMSGNAMGIYSGMKGISGTATLNLGNCSAVKSGCAGMTEITHATGPAGDTACTSLEHLFNGCTSLSSLSISVRKDRVLSYEGILRQTNVSSTDWLQDVATSVGRTRSGVSFNIAMQSCPALVNVDWSSIYYSSTQGDDYFGTFANCPNVTSLRLTISGNPTAGIGYDKFASGCTGLQNAQIDIYGNVHRMNIRSAFYGCTSLKSAGIYSNASQSGPLYWENTFKGDSKIETVTGTTAAIFKNASSCYGMFNGCSSLTSICGYTSLKSLISAISANYLTNNATHRYMFSGCRSFPDTFISAEANYQYWFK